jgi:molybdate transport system permease protein
MVAGVAALFIVIPIAALFARTPWGRVSAVLRSPAVTQSLKLSLWCSLLATVISIAIGLPLSYVLARYQFFGRSFVRALTILPVVLPPVAGGLALLLAFGRRGILGEQLYNWFGIQLAFTTTAAVLAETFVALPFFVLSMESAFAKADRSIDDVAATLGARPSRRFFSVTLPALRSAFGAAVALTWARALGEFGATVTFAGSTPGRTQTVPLAVYAAFETDPDAAIILSLLLVCVSLTILVLTGRRFLPDNIAAIPRRTYFGRSTHRDLPIKSGARLSE